MKLINIFLIILTIGFISIGNLYAKSQEVYLLPSINGEPSKKIPTEKDWSRWLWLIQYDGGESNYYLSGLLPGDTLGVFFIPPEPCSIIEVHFCKYMWADSGVYTYYGLVADIPEGVTLNSYEEYHNSASMPGPSAIGTIFASNEFDFPYTGDWQWDTLDVPGQPNVGMEAFWAGFTIEDTTHSTRIDPGVYPPYHAIGYKQRGAGPQTNGPGWYSSWHLFWIRALVRVYWVYFSVEAEHLLGTYYTGDRIVHIYTEDFSYDTTNLGIDEIILYYFVEDGTDTLEASVVQDSVDDTTPYFEYAWWHAVIPGQVVGSVVSYWVEATDNEGAEECTYVYGYGVGGGNYDYGLLYMENDVALGVMGIHNAFEGLPWDLWWENEGGVADSTVTGFYATGDDGDNAISWLSFVGHTFAHPYEPGWSHTQVFRNFMDNGGCLFLGGQDIPGGGYSLGYGEWEAPPSPHPLRDYLKAYAGDDDYILSSPFTVFVDTTDVVALGMPEEVTVDCATAMQSTWVGIFTELDDECVPLFFDEEGNILGYRYEDQELGFKLVFLYFPFHAITDTIAQDIFIENITNWFGVGVEEEHVEFVYKLPMISPNPLSSSTTINFTIPKNEYVSIKIYDVKGSLINKLVDENLSAGIHSITIDIENLTSGVYFLKMDTSTFSKTRKFLVVK